MFCISGAEGSGNLKIHPKKREDADNELPELVLCDITCSRCQRGGSYNNAVEREKKKKKKGINFMSGCESFEIGHGSYLEDSGRIF